jgi:hypothetical protein
LIAPNFSGASPWNLSLKTHIIKSDDAKHQIEFASQMEEWGVQDDFSNYWFENPISSHPTLHNSTRQQENRQNTGIYSTRLKGGKKCVHRCSGKWVIAVCGSHRLFPRTLSIIHLYSIEQCSQFHLSLPS